MGRIVGAIVKRSATTSAKEARAFARNYGKATGSVRKTPTGFAIGETRGRRVAVAQDLTVIVR